MKPPNKRIGIDFNTNGHILTIVETDSSKIFKILKILEVTDKEINEKDQTGFNNFYFDHLKELMKK